MADRQDQTTPTDRRQALMRWQQAEANAREMVQNQTTLLPCPFCGATGDDQDARRTDLQEREEVIEKVLTENERLRSFIHSIVDAHDAMVCRLTRDAAKEVLNHVAE